MRTSEDTLCTRKWKSYESTRSLRSRLIVNFSCKRDRRQKVVKIIKLQSYAIPVSTKFTDEKKKKKDIKKKIIIHKKKKRVVVIVVRGVFVYYVGTNQNKYCM